MLFLVKSEIEGIVSMKLSRTQVLSQSEIEQVNEVALRILEEVGFEIHGERILKLLKGGGAVVDFDNKRVRFPRKLVEECLLMVPAKIPWYDREGNLAAML